MTETKAETYRRLAEEARASVPGSVQTAVEPVAIR